MQQYLMQILQALQFQKLLEFQEEQPEMNMVFFDIRDAAAGRTRPMVRGKNVRRQRTDEFEDSFEEQFWE